MVVKEEQKNVCELSKKLKDILDEVLATGDWQSSPFLRATAVRLQNLRTKSNSLCYGNVNCEIASVGKDYCRKSVPIGCSQMFILLYQVDGANLQNWYRTIKNLCDYSVTHSVYKEEAHAMGVLRSKIANVDRNGYAVVNVKDDDFSPAEQRADQFGYPLFALKQGAVKLENIVEFVHGNKKRYAIGDSELVFLSNIITQ